MIEGAFEDLKMRLTAFVINEKRAMKGLSTIIMIRKIPALKNAIESGRSLAKVFGNISPKINMIAVVPNVVIKALTSENHLDTRRVAIEAAAMFTMLLPMRIAVIALS